MIYFNLFILIYVSVRGPVECPRPEVTRDRESSGMGDESKTLASTRAVKALSH